MTRMSSGHKPRRRNVKLQLGLGLLLVAVVISTAWYLTSRGFEGLVKGRVIAAIERATGGRTEIGQLTWNASKFELIATNVTIHGREGPNEVPFAHFSRVDARAKLFSFFHDQIDLTFLQLDRPVIHLITNPDGTTNQPRPKNAGTGTPVQQLISLAIDRAEIHDGRLLINNDTVPLDLSADDLRLAMTYASGKQQYDGSLDVGKLDVKYQNFRPVAAIAHLQFSLMPRELQLNKLVVTSGNTHLEAAGKIVNFADPQVTLSYTGRVDVAQAGTTARMPELQSGTARLTGDATFHAGDVRAVGVVSVEHGAFRNRSIEVPDLNAKAKFVATNAGVELTEMN